MIEVEQNQQKLRFHQGDGCVVSVGVQSYGLLSEKNAAG
jgi:hypothetical protein